ncbi:MAG: M23 family metallopeptidase [Clostridiaceae bacterium]
MDKKKLNRIFLLSAAGVFLLLGVIGTVRALQPETQASELVIFTQPEAEVIAIEPAEVAPSPSPEPVSYEGTVTLLVDRVPVMTLASELEAKKMLWEYLSVSAAAPEGERFVSARFDCELILTQGDAYTKPLEAFQALSMLQSNPAIVPIEVVTQRIEYSESSPVVQESTEGALPKGSRIVTQLGAGAVTQTVTEATYRAGEAAQLGTPLTVTLQEARASILRTGTYTKKDISGTAQRLEGPEGKSAGDLKLAYPMRGQVVKYFGYTNGEMNNGLDITNKAGTDITAPGEGLVVYCGERGAYGFVVDIDHGNGFVSRLTHLTNVQVEMNQRVFTGDLIGSLAEDEDGGKPVFHYELIIDGIPYNPLYYIS